MLISINEHKLHPNVKRIFEVFTLTKYSIPILIIIKSVSGKSGIIISNLGKYISTAKCFLTYFLDLLCRAVLTLLPRSYHAPIMTFLNLWNLTIQLTCRHVIQVELSQVKNKWYQKLFGKRYQKMPKIMLTDEKWKYGKYLAQM